MRTTDRRSSSWVTMDRQSDRNRSISACSSPRDLIVTGVLWGSCSERVLGAAGHRSSCRRDLRPLLTSRPLSAIGTLATWHRGLATTEAIPTSDAKSPNRSPTFAKSRYLPFIKSTASKGAYCLRDERSLPIGSNPRRHPMALDSRPRTFLAKSKSWRKALSGITNLPVQNPAALTPPAASSPRKAWP